MQVFTFTRPCKRLKPEHDGHDGSSTMSNERFTFSEPTDPFSPNDVTKSEGGTDLNFGDRKNGGHNDGVVITNGLGDEADDGDRKNGGHNDGVVITDDLGDEADDDDRKNGGNNDGVVITDDLGDEADESDRDDGNKSNDGVITELDLVRIFNLTGDDANIGTAEELDNTPALVRIENAARMIENQLVLNDIKAESILRDIQAKMALHEQTYSSLYRK